MKMLYVYVSSRQLLRLTKVSWLLVAEGVCIYQSVPHCLFFWCNLILGNEYGDGLSVGFDFH